jgi:hypothetical protein
MAAMYRSSSVGGGAKAVSDDGCVECRDCQCANDTYNKKDDYYCSIFHSAHQYRLKRFFAYKKIVQKDA